MDCIEAQRLVSAALDRDKVDADALQAAKDHCRGCAECTAFVRTLALMQRTTLPQPPADLPERTMSRVREYIEAEQARQERAAIMARVSEAAPPSPIAEKPASAPAPLTTRALLGRIADPRNRRAVIAWASAAAALLIAFGWAANAGVRAILVPGGSRTLTAADVQQGNGEIVYSDQDAVSKSQAEGVAGAPSTQPSTPAGNYITVAGVVYRLAGPSSGTTSTLAPIGTTTSSLSTSGTATSRTVLGMTGTTRVYVVDDSGTSQAYDRVSRVFDGRTYVLTSVDISRYGEWPRFPSGMTAPTQANGSPGFIIAGTDAYGTGVYRKSSASAATGIAIAPGSTASDPAAGNPNWTWWAPVP